MFDSYQIIKKAAQGRECLTVRQLALMIVVIEDKINASIDRYAKLLKINKPATTRAANRLCELGYLSRMRDPSDQRKIILQATDKGCEFFKELVK